MPLHSATPAPAILGDLMTQVGFKADEQPIFINFFRTDCPWCASAIPHLGEVYARHPTLMVHVVGIAVGNDTPEMATAFAQEKALPFPVIADTDSAFKTAFAIERVPSVVAVNAQGLVERTYEGITEQLGGILEQTIYALAHHTEPPEYDMVGNGCAP